MANIQDTDEIYIQDVVSHLTAHWKFIFFPCLTALIVSSLYAFSIQNEFRAFIVTAPSSSEQAANAISSLAGNLGSIASVAGISLPGETNVEGTLAFMRSRKFVNSFITENHLKPLIFHKQYDSEKSAWKYGILKRTKDRLLKLLSYERRTKVYALGEPTDEDTYEEFMDDILEISWDKKSDLITVTVIWIDPLVATEWANHLVSKLNQELKARAVEKSERSISFLNEQLALTPIADLRSSLFRLVEEEVKKISLAKATDEYALAIIDPAIIPEEKSGPKRILIILCSTLLALLGSCSFLIFGRFSSKIPLKS